LELTELLKLMDRLIEQHAGGDMAGPANLVTAGIIAAEEAVKAGVVSGPLWDEYGAHLLASHYAYFRGVPIGTFTVPVIAQRLREIQELSSTEDSPSANPVPRSPEADRGSRTDPGSS
jgi:hypothetical protein